MWTLFFVVASVTICPTLASGETTALILARGGSKGVRLKNLQPVGGLSLLSRAIIAAKTAGLGVTVSTDHFLIAYEAIRSGASIHKRSTITASDWAPSIWGASEFLSSRPEVDILVLIQATSPFIKAEVLRDAVKKIDHPVAYDCVFSVSRSYKLRWREVNGIASPINFDINSRPRRQDWDGELVETGAFYISRRNLIDEGRFQNNNSDLSFYARPLSKAASNEVPAPATSAVPVTRCTEGSAVLICSAKPKAMTTASPEPITYEDLESTDVISVELVPERKGLILKHCEYFVSSRKHGTTVSRRYNDFVQLYDVLFAKYPYRAICRLPPKRVVVGGGSPKFLQRRRAALQRWLTLVARHPVLAHDADLRSFLCEASLKLDKPKHDEFVLAGTQDEPRSQSTEDMQALFSSEHEQLRLVQLGLGRLYQIFERAESRFEAERADIRCLSAGLSALGVPACGDSPRWLRARDAARGATQLATESGESPIDELDFTEDGPGGRMLLSLDALEAHRALTARLTRGLHAERAAAAHSAPHSAASQLLRDRHRYSLRCGIEEAQICRAYALSALECLPELCRTQGKAHGALAQVWSDLCNALLPSRH